MKINKVKICNVKGISEYSLNALLYPNRPNILVAPNGFGKSSFATAFASIEPGGIRLSEDDAHDNNIANLPSVEIGLTDNRNLVADSQTNTIKNVFHICVAHNALRPTAKAQHFSGRTIAKAYMDIKPTVLIQTIPQCAEFRYNHAAMKRNFGPSGKILPNISKLYRDAQVLVHIEEQSGIHFREFDLQRFKTPMDVIKAQIDSMSAKTGALILRWMETESIFAGKLQDFDKLKDILKDYFQYATNAEAYLAAWQYIERRKELGTIEYKKALNYVKFLKEKEHIDVTLDSINPVKDRFTIESTVDDRTLLIKWPKANQISGGQRDSMVFISQLMECEFHHTGNCLLIVDEFFDYLDDANIVAFQYYISTMIENFKRSSRLIFPILLTHLDPKYLKHFCFNETRLNVVYLQETSARLTKPMKNLVEKRETAGIKDILDKYYFHYYHPIPDGTDFIKEFNAHGLNADWSNPFVFHKKIQRELRKYAYKEGAYDPVAVCLATRVRIEELIYNQIRDEVKKRELLATHKTRDKLNYALKNGAIIPETYFLLSIVYNNPLHDAPDDLEKPLGMKLENSTILNMIKHLWQ